MELLLSDVDFLEAKTAKEQIMIIKNQYDNNVIYSPEIERRRIQHNYSDKVILLLDGLLTHYSDNFIKKCSQLNIKIIF